MLPARDRPRFLFGLRGVEEEDELPLPFLFFLLTVIRLPGVKALSSITLGFAVPVSRGIRCPP